MSDLKRLQDRAIQFRDDRDWKQFHIPKDMAISLLGEAFELLEEFKWMDENEIESHLKNNRESVVDEVIDVLYNLLIISRDLEIDIEKEFERKMRQNEKKYPIEKSKGSHTKYSKL